MTTETATAASATDEELERFEAGEVDPASFDHVAHVRLAFEMCERYPFHLALGRYATGLQRVATSIGRPEKYHATITVAFLALVAERRARSGARDWESFAAAAPDLLDRRALLRWYDADVLADEVARATFVLPARRAEG